MASDETSGRSVAAVIGADGRAAGTPTAERRTGGNT